MKIGDLVRHRYSKRFGVGIVMRVDLDEDGGDCPPIGGALVEIKWADRNHFTGKVFQKIRSNHLKVITEES